MSNIRSINAVKPETLPQRAVRNTEKREDAKAILESLRKATTGAVSIQLEKCNKYTRYGMYKALQKAGGKNLRVTLDQKTKVLGVVQETEERTGIRGPQSK